MFPRDMVCLRKISVETVHEEDTEDDDDDNDYNNNNNNKINAGTSDVSTMNSNTRISATRCSLGTWFFSGT
jgi:hypothetical protein